jgi:hypothetical protein
MYTGGAAEHDLYSEPYDIRVRHHFTKGIYLSPPAQTNDRIYAYHY